MRGMENADTGLGVPTVGLAVEGKYWIQNRLGAGRCQQELRVLDGL